MVTIDLRSIAFIMSVSDDCITWQKWLKCNIWLISFSAEKDASDESSRSNHFTLNFLSLNSNLEYL